MVKQKKEQFRNVAVFPCKLRVMAEHVYTRRDPIVCGVRQMKSESEIFIFFLTYSNACFLVR